MIEAACDSGGRMQFETTCRATSETAGGKLWSIQAMRGVAALAVVALHVYVIYLRPDYGQVIAFAPILSKGWVGVNLFFVISGFIIMNAHAKDIGRPSRIPRYLWQRFTGSIRCTGS